MTNRPPIGYRQGVLSASLETFRPKGRSCPLDTRTNLRVLDTRIEGAKLTDMQVETLLSNLTATSFKTRDEREVAGYAEAMDIIFQAYDDVGITENHTGANQNTLKVCLGGGRYRVHPASWQG